MNPTRWAGPCRLRHMRTPATSQVNSANQSWELRANHNPQNRIQSDVSRDMRAWDIPPTVEWKDLSTEGSSELPSFTIQVSANSATTQAKTYKLTYLLSPSTYTSKYPNQRSNHPMTPKKAGSNWANNRIPKHRKFNIKIKMYGNRCLYSNTTHASYRTSAINWYSSAEVLF